MIKFNKQNQYWDNHKTLLITMEVDGFLMGSARIQNIDGEVTLESFYIETSNKGYGKLLMEEIEKYLTGSRLSVLNSDTKQVLKINQVYLMVKQTNKYAIRLYESFGYKLFKPEDEEYDWYYKTY